MQFHDFRTTRDLVGNKVPVADFYGTNFTIALAAMEEGFHRASRHRDETTDGIPR